MTTDLFTAQVLAIMQKLAQEHLEEHGNLDNFNFVIDDPLEENDNDDELTLGNYKAEIINPKDLKDE